MTVVQQLNLDGRVLVPGPGVFAYAADVAVVGRAPAALDDAPGEGVFIGGQTRHRPGRS